MNCVIMLQVFIMFIGVCLCATLTAGGEKETIRLGKLNVDREHVTLSGFSAGASMATQTHIAHSSLFSGVAMFSQVFYHCGPRNILEFGIFCSLYGRQIFPYDVSKSIKAAENYARNGQVDPLENIKEDKVFLWIGAEDEFVPVQLAKKNKDFYETFVANPSQISLTVRPKAKHLFPTINYGNGCDQDASKNVYLGSCGYSGAFESLKFLLGSSRIKMAGDESNFNPSSLHLYNQSEFYPDGSIRDAAMGQAGFIYIPEKCRDRKNSTSTCLLHINFHGCEEYEVTIARRYIENNGFLPVAEANGIIVVFPLTDKVPGNMGGCWDFYSYTGRDFATKQGKQVHVVYNILQRILYGEQQSLLII